ncbi:MAG TPA: hypothetical protein PKH65_02340 [Bacteroidia bacterium]|nr:hypothetical protein [Bacteroidia bacterium]
MGVLPDFDENRVYNSDIKKMLSWFSYVKDVVDKEDEENEMMDKIKLSESDQPLDHGNSSSKVKTTESKASSQRSRTKV